MMKENFRSATSPVIPGRAKGREPGISRFPDAQLRIWGLVLRTIPEMTWERKAHRHFSRDGGGHSPLAGTGLAERGLGRGEAGDRHAIGRTRHVIQSDLVAERNRGGIAAMLAANT